MCYRGSARAGWPGVSILSLHGTASLISKSQCGRKSSLRYTTMLLKCHASKQATNKQVDPRTTPMVALHWRQQATQSAVLHAGAHQSTHKACIHPSGTDHAARVYTGHGNLEMSWDMKHNNNNNRIQRRYSRFFTISSQPREPSPTRTLKWPGRNRVQIT